ncbi:MAG: hypothetical protein PHY48_15075 [Candidatus Cloacimonetes bacterium]|nr:hypothetical protein [Candidatus Cloacimonadota bacterium]
MKKALFTVVVVILILVIGLIGVNKILWTYLTHSSKFSWGFDDLKGQIYTGMDDLNNTEIDKFISTKPSGKMTYYNKNSKIICTYNLLKGNRHGAYKCWDDNGRLIFCFNYEDGVLHGNQESWWSNGKKMTFESYVNGSREGSFTNWYKNGQIASIESYSNNVHNGRCFSFTKSGDEIGNCIESNGFTISGTRIISKDGDHKILLGTFENGVLKKQWYYVEEY